MSASRPADSAALRREIPGAGAQLLAALSKTDQDKLLQAVRAAKQRQRKALEAAIDEGMTFVPALLRGVLRRILFP